MKKQITFFKYIIIGISVIGQTPANDPHWVLEWEDGFDDNTIDFNKWTVLHWAHGNKQTLYLKENVNQEDGNLVLTMNGNNVSCYQGHPQSITVSNPPCVLNKLYNNNSGWIESNEAFNLKYGYIEAKVKVPFGYGFFPGFWTFIGVGVNGINGAEIDIFEMLGGSNDANSMLNTPNALTTNVHYIYPNDAVSMYQEIVPNFNYTTWHTYGVEWSPTKIIWYLDGIPIRNFPNHQIVDYVRVILNFAINPSLPPNSSTPFPSSMYVDYVKTYKLANDCNTILNVCNYNFMLHDNRVKKNIIIGNNNCTNSLISGQKIFLRASEGILLNGDFNVPLGAELYIDANTCY